jgi:hypothetical protein
VQHRKKQEQMVIDKQQALLYKKDPLFDFDD